MSDVHNGRIKVPYVGMGRDENALMFRFIDDPDTESFNEWHDHLGLLPEEEASRKNMARFLVYFDPVRTKSKP